MFAGFEEQLQRYADVIVRLGVALRPGQRLVVTDPYELIGVDRAAEPLVTAVERAARAAGAAAVEIVRGDEAAWRAAARDGLETGFAARLEAHTERLARAVGEGAALVFLMGTHPQLGDGVPAAGAARVRRACGAAYGRLAPALLAGATNWTAAPVPNPGWAEMVFGDVPADERLPRLWAAVFASARADRADPVAAWEARIATLAARAAALEQRRLRQVRFRAPGTDLLVGLAPAHRWCTALLRTRDGRRFVPNLPTEEVFTAPRADAAEGCLRVARPVAQAGGVIEGIELEFRGGTVVRARARRGAALLERLLASDRGACRLGEVALVEGPTPAADSGRCFGLALLDENALHHVALGDAYDFTVGAGGRRRLNRSVLHLDLPVGGEAELS